YEYTSIMHYGKNFFGKISEDNSRILTTIITKNKDYQDKIGQREGLSDTDVDAANKLYDCLG
ncbi:predicted protein, partial [Nematostella vectensis]